MDRMADWRTEHSYTLKAGNLLGAPRIIKRKPGQPTWTLFTVSLISGNILSHLAFRKSKICPTV